MTGNTYLKSVKRGAKERIFPYPLIDCAKNKPVYKHRLIPFILDGNQSFR